MPRTFVSITVLSVVLLAITGWFGGDACLRYAPTEDTFFMDQEFHGKNHGGLGFAEAHVEFREEE